MSDSTALVPDEVIEPTEYVNPENIPNHRQYYAGMAKLTTVQRQVLSALIENLVSGERKSEVKIAKELGINRNTILNCRQNPIFADLLAKLSVAAIKGTVDTVIQNLHTIAATDKGTKANEILLRIAEVYQPTQRNLNINANVSRDSTQTMSAKEIVDSLIIKLGELSYTPERYAERYAELKAEGAF